MLLKVMQLHIYLQIRGCSHISTDSAVRAAGPDMRVGIQRFRCISSDIEREGSVAAGDGPPQFTSHAKQGSQESTTPQNAVEKGAT